MAIQLSKGQRIDLTKTNPTLKNIVVGLGWDVKTFDGGAEFDLDASAFLLNAEGKCRQDTDFIFYNNLRSPEGSVEHTGDNRTGGMGSDEDIPESAAAKKYLMRKGLAEDRILTEDKSTSTTENFIYAKDILIKNNAKPNELRIVIVSSSFHLYRASLLAKAQGFENVSFIGSKGLFYLMPHYYAREYAAYVREVLF